MRVSKLKIGKWRSWERWGILMKIKFTNQHHVLIVWPYFGDSENSVKWRFFTSTLFKDKELESIGMNDYGLHYEIGSLDEEIRMEEGMGVKEHIKRYAIKKAINYFEFEYENKTQI